MPHSRAAIAGTKWRATFLLLLLMRRLIFINGGYHFACGRIIFILARHECQECKIDTYYKSKVFH
ncbi:hypothetical protein SAMN06265348_11157 [Pedobacter westerhofensis]|uniref:Uncharacterized protein n=1 Tax=Pedobacter westerhofensis TaxID=425512 RepID=A0A521FBK8_9SPHI|nr:hypothetical protein SAMN06265348_11157 [Pedobacter westerhofensis]